MQTWLAQVDSPPPTLSSLWGYFQRELLILAWATTEVTLIAPTFLALTRWAVFWEPALTAAWMLLILLLSFNLVRLMTMLQITQEHQRNIVVLALLMMVLLTTPTMLYVPRSPLDFGWIPRLVNNLGDINSPFWARDVGVFLAILLLWWRGIRLSHQGFSVSRAGLRLRLGSLIGSPFVAWFGRRLDWDVTPFLLTFFFSAIATVALARAEQIEQDRSGHSASLGPRWLTGIGAASLGIVFASSLFVSFVNQGLATPVLARLLPIWRAITFIVATTANIVGYLAQPLAWLLARLAQAIASLMQRVLSSFELEALTLPEPGLPAAQATAEALEGGRSMLNSGRAIAVLVLLALILIIGLTLRRAYRHSTPAPGSHEYFADRGQREVGQRPTLGRRLLRRIGLYRRRRVAASIRRIYLEMSEAAAACGFPRTLSETPLEYLDSLGQVWPENTDDASFITDAYIRVRYGAIPETKEELLDISAAWQRLKHTRPSTVESETISAELNR